MSYVSDIGLVALPFGLLFTTTGSFVLGTVVWSFFAQPAVDWQQQVVRILAILAIGGGHLLVGTGLLWRNRVCLDRERGVVSRRTGWLGLVRRQFPLSDDNAVTIIPARPGFWSLATSRSRQQVILTGPGGAVLPIGIADQPGQAEELRVEICDFLNLPCCGSSG
ncbi:MAG: hypothetical protein ACK5Q5_19045 [Planctomycetaceae bacterium]